MNIIFENGEKLYFKSNPAQLIQNLTNIKLHKYQEQILNGIQNNNNKIYGDDFLIEIIKENIQGDCVLSIQDFDENQNKESEININFSEQELGQFIHLLQHVYDTW